MVFAEDSSWFSGFSMFLNWLGGVRCIIIPLWLEKIEPTEPNEVSNYVIWKIVFEKIVYKIVEINARILNVKVNVKQL